MVSRLIIVILTLIYNLDESFLFEPKHLGSMMFVLACVGLKIERMRLQEPTPTHLRNITRPGSLLRVLQSTHDAEAREAQSR